VNNRLITLICLFLAAAPLAGCGATATPSRPTPKPTLDPRLKPTPSPLEQYLIVTSDTYESINYGTRTMLASANVGAQDAVLFNKREWRQPLTAVLMQMRMDYQTLVQLQPPAGSEEYHQAMLDAEVHDDRAAELLLVWLDDKEVKKYNLAIAEMDSTQAGIKRAQEIFDRLFKK
jgi:hypothetical protein